MLKSVSFANPASSIKSNSTTGILQITGPAAGSTRVMTVPDANFTVARIDAAQSFTGDQTLATGNLVIGTAGKGIDFSADPSAPGMTSELLDDYEEGTWTPAQGSGLTVVGDFSSSGTYTKIGRQVTVSGRMQGATSVAIGAGGLLTNNLPFATASSGTGAAVDSTATKNSALIAYSGGSVQIYSANATTASPFVDFSLTYLV